MTLGESPFNVIQLLWINMIMDTLAAIALATEPPHPTELKKDKIKKYDKIILKGMWRHILSQAIYQMIVLLVLLYAGPIMFNINYDYINEPFYYTNQMIAERQAAEPNNPEYVGLVEGDLTRRAQHYTLIFATFVMMQLFNMFNSRKLGLKEFNIFSNFFNNFWFFAIVAIEFAATWFMITLGSKIFRSVLLTFPMLITAFAFGIGTWLIALGVKATPPELVEKFPELINENAGEGNDFLSILQKKLQGEPVKRSETERLLDSQ
jgi:magnesium-transporting ATPase (P-type)